MRVCTALTIAGSDSGGGAGVQADLKTFLDHGVYGMSAVTAITAQNTRGVLAVSLVEPRLVEAQLRAIFDDFPVDAMKTGMLGSAAIVHAVCAVLESLPVRPRLVVDPVLSAKDGATLLDLEALDVLRGRLLPLATLVTPNLPEAAALGALPGAVLLKGGHGEGAWVNDVLTLGDTSTVFRHPRIESRHTHGTGCTLSAAITARLALGADVVAACSAGVSYVSALVLGAADGSLGGGHGPLLHGLRTR